MKRLIVSLSTAALCLSAQVATVPNTDFPTFRANLNTSLQNAASISGAYVNPGFIMSLSFTKLFNVPLFAHTDQANTWTAGVQDFSAAPHLRLPTAANYNPNVSGYIGYDTLSNTYKGFVGTVKTFAYTDSNITGNAATATQLSANGSNCDAGSYATGVDASGNAEGCTAAGAASGSDTGTPSDTYQIGSLAGGPRLERSGTGLQISNAGGTAREAVEALEFRSPPNTPFVGSGLLQAEPAVTIPTLYFDIDAGVPQFKNDNNVKTATTVKFIADPGDHLVAKYVASSGALVRGTVSCGDIADAGPLCAASSAPVPPRNIALATFLGHGLPLAPGQTPGVSLSLNAPLAAGCVAAAWTATVDVGTIGIQVWRVPAGSTAPTAGNAITTSDLVGSASANPINTSFANFAGGIAPVFQAGDRITVQLNAATSATYGTFSIQCQ